MEAQKKLKAEQEAAAAAAASHNPSTHVITPDYAAGLIAPAMAVRIDFSLFYLGMLIYSTSPFFFDKGALLGHYKL